MYKRQDVSFAPRDDLSAYDIYEIDIVTSVPSAGKAAVSLSLIHISEPTRPY